jgi:hypothetical protein
MVGSRGAWTSRLRGECRERNAEPLPRCRMFALSLSVCDGQSLSWSPSAKGSKVVIPLSTPQLGALVVLPLSSLVHFRRTRSFDTFEGPSTPAVALASPRDPHCSCAAITPLVRRSSRLVAPLHRLLLLPLPSRPNHPQWTSQLSLQSHSPIIFAHLGRLRV